MSNFKCLLSYITTGRDIICRLCLNKIEGKCRHLEDEVLLDDNLEANYNTIYNILQEILHNKVAAEFKYTDSICQKCVRSVIHCYTFLRMCEKSNNMFHSVLNNLTDCISTFKVEELYISKAIYISICESAACEIIYDNRTIVSKPTSVLRRFKVLTNKAKETENVMNDNEISNDYKLDNYICDKCNKTFNKKTHMRTHYYRVHAPKNFHCSQCSKCFGSNFLLRQHMTIGHTNLICSECGKSFKNYISFKKHESSHKSKLICPKCGRHYRNRESFIKHMKLGLCHKKRRCKADTDEKELYSCDLCQKTYVQKGSLVVHMKFEHGDGKAHVCEWCGKKFTAQSRLKSHIVKHTKEKNFTCLTCGGKFVTKESLLYHTRLHTGEKPYPCQYCDEKFLSASRRMIHIRWRHLEPSFQCDVCAKKFKTMSYLKVHLSKHEKINGQNNKDT